MSNFGQAALTIVGTVVGAYFGYPQLGFALGSLAGQAFFPTKLPGVSGPRLNDARTTTAQLGGPVMEVIGTDAVPGNVIWMGPMREVAQTEEVGGKGGPSQSSTSYSYFQSLALGLCRGPMGGIVRIWENGKLVYDARDQLEDESDEQFAARTEEAQAYAQGFVLYLGDEEQEPDPTIELDKGVGNVPAYRGLMYIVFPSRELKQEQGLRHPNFKFEVSRTFVGNCNLQFSNEVLHPWLDLSNPVNPLNENEYYSIGGNIAGEFTPTNSFINALDQIDTIKGYSFRQVMGYGKDASYATGNILLTGEPLGDFDRNVIGLTINETLPDDFINDAQFAAETSIGGACMFSGFQGPPGRKKYTSTWGLSETTAILSAGYAGIPPLPNGNWENRTGCGGPPDGIYMMQYTTDGILFVRRSPSNPNPDDGWIDAPTHIYRVLQTFAVAGGPGGDDRYPLNPCVPFGDPNFYDEDFWTAAYDDAVADGKMQAGFTYGNEYPIEQDWAYVRGGVPNFEFNYARIWPWLYNAVDPRNPLNSHRYQPSYDVSGGSDWYLTLGAAQGAAADGFNDAISPPLVSGVLGHNPHFSASYNVQPWMPYDHGAPDGVYPPEQRQGTKDHVILSIFFNQYDGGSGTFVTEWNDFDVPLNEQVFAIFAAHGQHHMIIDRQSDPLNAGWTAGVLVPGGMPTSGVTLGVGGTYFIGEGVENLPANAFAWQCYDYPILTRRVLVPPPEPDSGSAWVIDDTGRSWRILANVSGSGFNGMASTPLGPARPEGHYQYDDEDFWTTAYNAAVIAGEMRPGLTYGMDYPVGMTGSAGIEGNGIGYARVNCAAATGTPGLVSLASVIEYICGRVGVTAGEIDVTDLTSIEIGGYTVTRVMAARDALEPLRNVGFFDVIESGDVLKFRKRGKAVDRVIDPDHFAREAGQEQPDITTKDLLETDLPRIVRVHYKAPSRDYEDGEQISPARSTSSAVNDADIELAVSLPDDMAAQIAEVIWADAWEGRRSHDFTLDAYHVDLESGDVLSVPVDGYYQRVRLGAVDDSIAMLRKWEAFRDYDGSYVSRAVADPPERAPGAIVILKPSEIIFLDIPALREEDDDAGFYLTTRPNEAGATWKGAALYKSDDDGATFTSSVGVSTESTTGSVVTAIPDGGDALGFDDAYALTVNLRTGELESRSDADLALGANAIAVGAHGRWEILQFGEVEQIGASQYRLTHLLRGRRGTEHNMGTMEVGDTFVLVSGKGIVRMPLLNSEIGVERLYKAVTFGMQYNTGIDYPFTGQAEALVPFSPCEIEFELLEGGDLSIAWKRRGRLGQELDPAGGEIPLSEAVEAYEIDIRVPGSSPGEHVRTLTSSVQSVVYPVALQVEDFGDSATIFEACIYQMSAVVGRGTPGCAVSPIAANLVAGSLEALPFVPSYDDRPSLIGTTSEGFLFARRGKKGEEFLVGFYFWPAGASTGDVVQFDDNYDGDGTEFFPTSYFAGANVQNNFKDGENTPTHGFAANQSEFSLYYRINPAGGAAQKWLISGEGDSLLTIVPRASVPLTSTTRGINALLPMGGGTIYALASEVSISPTNKPDVYRSLNGGETWAFVATTTGDLPTMEWLSAMRLFEHDGAVHVMTPFGNYVNAAGDLIDWSDHGATLTPVIDAIRGADPIAAVIDFDYTATEIVAIGFSAESFTSEGGYVGQKNKIVRSTDGGATFSVVRNEALSSDIAPGFAFPLQWNLIRRFGSGYAVYGRALTAFAFPYVLLSTDAGATFATAVAVNTGDVTGNAVIQQALSDGTTIFAIDTKGKRKIGGDGEFNEAVSPVVYGRLSYSTDAINFTALPGFYTGEELTL